MKKNTKTNKLFFNRWTITGLIFLFFSITLFIYNKYDDIKAGKNSEDVLLSLNEKIGDYNEEDHYFEDLKGMEMPVIQIGGYNYIGKLIVEKVGLELPIMEDWSYPKLKISPNRYTGSVYDNNIVIAGHNFTNHFGKLYQLNKNDLLIFKDVEGREFKYEVIRIETLEPQKVEDFVDNGDGDWDITLFTCTLSGETRKVIRGKLKSN